MLSYDTPTTTPIIPGLATAAETTPDPSSTATVSQQTQGYRSIFPKQSAMAPSISENLGSSAAATAGGEQVHPYIWIVTGPAGCGKSTVAEHLATSLDMPYIEGDQYHPPANIDKMSNGTPLNDADRWDWLILLRDEAVKQLCLGGAHPRQGVVVTCSALKRKYRDVMRVAPYFQPGVQLRFIYLRATEEALLKRVAARQNHYMGANMVRSQFEALEPPSPDESDVVSIDVSHTVDEVKAEAQRRVKEAMGRQP